jgi:hypothetical protein
MSSEEKTVEEKINWIPLVALTALLSFIGTVAVALNGSVGQVFMCRYAWGTFSKTMAIPIMGVILVLLTYPLKRIGLSASPSTLVTLFIVGMVVSYYGIGHYETFACWPVGFARTVLQSPDDLKQLMNTWWWQPRYEVVELVTTGGAATDWGAWGGSIVFWSLYLLVLFALGSSMMLLFRRRWIDIEKVPFPHIITIGEIIGRIGSGEKEKKVAWPFIAGFIIGLVFEAIILLTNLFPWFPDLLAWRTGLTGETTSAQGCVCIHPGDPLGSVLVHWGGYTKNLLPFAIYYLAPLSVTLTVAIVTLFMFIADQVVFAMGYYTGIFQMGGSCRVQGWGGMEASYGYGPPFYWVFTTSIGGTVAMATMIIFHSRGYLAETIRAARSGSSSEIEGKEAFSYRMIYAFIGVSVVLVLAFLLSAGLGFGTALSILIVSGIINTLSAVYVVGLSGSAYIHNSYMWADWPLRFTWPQAPEAYTTSWIMSHVFASNGLNHVTMGFQTGAYLTMQGFSLSSMSKARARDLFLLMSLCTIVAVPVANMTRVWITNLLGTGRVPIWGNCAVSNWCNDGFERYNAVSTTIQLEAGIVGFIIVTALSLLHARFVWWPIHPVGFILATSTTTMYMFEWNAFVGAWIAKALTLRVGGSKAYGNYGVPVVAGIIGGIVTASFIAYILGMIRFFVPF